MTNALNGAMFEVNGNRYQVSRVTVINKETIAESRIIDNSKCEKQRFYFPIQLVSENLCATTG